MKDQLGGACGVGVGRVLPVGEDAGDLLGGEAGAGHELEKLGQERTHARDAQVQRDVGGVHVHQRGLGVRPQVVADRGAGAAWVQRAQRVADPDAERRRLHGDVVAAGDRGELSAMTLLRGGVDAGAERLGDREPISVVVDVVHDRGSVRHRQPGGVEADALGAASDDQHRAAGAPFELGYDGAPSIGEVVACRRHPERVDAVGDRHQHVVGVRDQDLVGDHAAPRPAGRTEPVRRELTDPRGGALGGDAAAALGAGAARDRPRHHDGLPDGEVRDVVALGHHLADALVPDAERTPERDRPQDGTHRRVDPAELQAELQGTGHRPMDGQRVSVAAGGHERSHECLPWTGQRRSRLLPPLQSAPSDELQLSHRTCLPSAARRRPSRPKVRQVVLVACWTRPSH